MRSRSLVLVILALCPAAISCAEPPPQPAWNAPQLSQAAFSSDGKAFVARFSQSEKHGVAGNYQFTAVFSIKGERIATLPPNAYSVGNLMPVLRPGHSEVLLARRRPPNYSTGSEEMFLWDYQRTREVRTFTTTSSIGSLAFSPDGKMVLSGHWDKRIRAWDADNGKLIRSFDLPRKLFEKLSSGNIAEFFFLPDGKRVAAGFMDSVNFFDTSTGKKAKPELKDYDKAQKSSLHTLAAISQNGRYACTTKPAIDHSGDRLRLWDLKTGKLMHSFNLPDKTAFSSACSFAGKGRLLVVLDGSGRLHTFDVATGKHLKQFPLQEKNPVWGAAFSPDGSLILAPGEKTTMMLWDTRTGKAVREFDVPGDKGLVND